MNEEECARDEERNRKLMILALFVFPMLSGLFTVSLGFLTDLARIDSQRLVLLLVFIVDTFVAGAACAGAVVYLHPSDRGKWWRAALAFLLALPLSFASIVLFGGTLVAFTG